MTGVVSAVETVQNASLSKNFGMIGALDLVSLLNLCAYKMTSLNFFKLII